MKNIWKILKLTCVILFACGVTAGIVDLVQRWKEEIRARKEQGEIHETYGVYERYFKRPLDFMLSGWALMVFSPVMLIIALLVRLKLGNPVLFAQLRPGKDEKLFKMYKFRTMTDERNKKGELLPDSERLTSFGKLLRSTSLDELPELLNIMVGDMSIVSPRPQLVRDMVFMSKPQRMRHKVRPGLSGLAQVNGRNSISWEEKLDLDLEYVKKITFLGDLKIILRTIIKVFKCEDITENGMETAMDLGDYLLQSGRVTKEYYEERQIIAKSIIGENNNEEYKRKA